MQARRRRLVLPIPRLRVGSLLSLLLRRAGLSYSHPVPPGSNPVSPNPSVAAGHGAGIGLGSLQHRVYTLM